MAQFDVFDIGRDFLVLDLQSDWVDVSTRVVAPLYHNVIRPSPFRNLEPDFIINDESYTLLTANMTAIPANTLHTPIASLAEQDYDIRKALDMVFSGF